MKLEYILVGVAVLVVLYLVMNRKETMTANIARQVNKPCAINEEFIDGMCYSKCPEGYRASSDYRICELIQTVATSQTISKEMVGRLLFNIGFDIHKYSQQYIQNTNNRILRFDKEKVDKYINDLNNLKKMGYVDARIDNFMPQLTNISKLMQNRIR